MNSKNTSSLLTIALAMFVFAWGSSRAYGVARNAQARRGWSFAEVVKSIELSGKGFYKEFIGVTMGEGGVIIACLSDELKLGLRGEDLFLKRDDSGKLKVVSVEMYDYYTYPDGYPKERRRDPERRIRLSHDCSLSVIMSLMKSDKRVPFDVFHDATLNADGELEISGSDSANPNQVLNERVVLKCDPSGQWRIARFYSYDP